MAVSTLGTIGSRTPALRTIWSSVSSASASAPVPRRVGEAGARSRRPATEAMRAIDEPMTRLICRTRCAEATSAAMRPPDLAQDLDVGCRERDLVVARHRVAERPPQRRAPCRRRARAGRHARRCRTRRPRAPSGARRRAGAACRRARPTSSSSAVHPRSARSSRTVRTASSPRAAGSRPGGSLTRTSRSVGWRGRRLDRDRDRRRCGTGSAVAGGGRAGRWRRDRTEQGLAPEIGRRPRGVEAGATRRTAATPGCGSTSHSSATRSPCQRTA